MQLPFGARPIFRGYIRFTPVIKFSPSGYPSAENITHGRFFLLRCRFLCSKYFFQTPRTSAIFALLAHGFNEEPVTVPETGGAAKIFLETWRMDGVQKPTVKKQRKKKKEEETGLKFPSVQMRFCSHFKKGPRIHALNEILECPSKRQKNMSSIR